MAKNQAISMLIFTATIATTTIHMFALTVGRGKIVSQRYNGRSKTARSATATHFL